MNNGPGGMANIFGILVALILLAAVLVWVERRLLAIWQDRLGPNRLGPFGLLQVAADMIKMFFKEDWLPPFADQSVFVLRRPSCSSHAHRVRRYPIRTGRRHH